MADNLALPTNDLSLQLAPLVHNVVFTLLRREACQMPLAFLRLITHPPQCHIPAAWRRFHFLLFLHFRFRQQAIQPCTLFKLKTNKQLRCYLKVNTTVVL
jgi:hypothetical protein